MPNTNAASASSLSARCFELPMERSRPTTTSWLRDSRSRIPSVNERITRARNVPRQRANGANASSRRRAGDITFTLRQPGPRLQTGHEWIARGTRLPADIHASTSVGRTHVKATLFAVAAGNSDYWRQSLGGRSLCVRYGNGAIACRVSPATDGSLRMHKSDAVIELTGDGPRAYSTLRSTTLKNRFQVEPFCYAAAQAAQLLAPPHAESSIANTIADYQLVIANHEAALNESMIEWIFGHEHELKEAAAQMMPTDPSAT